MNAPLPTPTPNKEEILHTLSVMFQPDDIIELRAIQKRPKKVSAGYFDGKHREQLVDEAIRYNNAGATVYVVLNQIDPQLLCRCSNRMHDFANTTTTDSNIIKRRWLLLDFDPVRASDTSSTKEQMDAAYAKLKEVKQYLSEQGWPTPIAGISGNGFHLYYPLDLPNDDTGRNFIKGALAGLAAIFDDDQIKIDQSVFNAARITKLFGTVANKGEHSLQAPWRLSRLLKKSKRDGVISVEQLQALAPALPSAALDIPSNTTSYSNFDLLDFLKRLGIKYTHDFHEGANRYKLAHCPFNPAHGKGEAAIFQWPDGKLGFKCQHNSCADKHWQDVRALVDGPRESRAHPSTFQENYEWPDLHPLPEGLPPVTPFDYEMLPDSLQPWAKDVCERMQCPPDFMGVAIMVSLGSVIGRKLAIRPQALDDWTVTPNLCGLVIGRPGVLKCPAIEAALSPLKRLEATANELHQQELENYEQLAQLAKLKNEEIEKEIRKALRRDFDTDFSYLPSVEKLEPPVLKRYIAHDTTIAALGEIHRQNPNGLLIIRDEIVALLKSLDRDDNSEAKGFYLTGWNGNSSYTIDRISRGMNLRIPAVCLSLLGTTQPGKIAEYIRAAVYGGARDDGLFQRFGLLVYPDIKSKWTNVDRLPDAHATREADRVFEYLASLNPVNIDADQDTDQNSMPYGQFYLRFEATAQTLFLNWRSNMENMLCSDKLHLALESHLAKYRKLVPSLALIIHLADGGTGPVSLKAMVKALKWANYLKSHAERVYASIVDIKISAAQAILKRLRNGKLASPFTARDVYRNGWAYLSDLEVVQAALDLLIDFNYIQKRQVTTAGRPTYTYLVNPKALST